MDTERADYAQTNAATRQADGAATAARLPTRHPNKMPRGDDGTGLVYD